jgi:glutamate dehydrogenase/leucine dehydrogenase
VEIVVISGTGLIGSKTVAILRQGGHEVIAASLKSGVNTITGKGLKAAMASAQVVIDLAPYRFTVARPISCTAAST